MDTMMFSLGIILVFLFNIQGINSQTYGCPTGWELFKSQCYKFVKDDPLIFEEADAACWSDGATLLQVDDFTEHKYVTDWLYKHDTLAPSIWFIGGSFYNGYVVWGEDKLDSSGNGYWLGNQKPKDNKLIRMAYVFGLEGSFRGVFGWDLVRPSVKSAYICEIDIKDTRDWKITKRTFEYGQGLIQTEVQKGPKLISNPKAVVIFGTARSVYIECDANGLPNPHFTWIRDDNTPVTSLTNNRYTISGGRFTIEDPDEIVDQGNYQCIAQNEFGKVLSDPARILFGYLQSFPPVKPEDVRANKFEGTRISCQAPAAYPAARYEWFQWSVEEFIFKENKNIFVSSSGYLYFSSVQPTDDRKYYCVVTLTASTLYDKANSQPPSRTSLGVSLIVTGTEHGLIQPFIYTHTFPSPALRGSQIRLECIAYGSLDLFYSWHREDGRPFQQGTTITDLSRVLTIENAQIEAEGNYICTVNGKGGNSAKRINLIVESRPYFLFGIGDKLVDPGITLKWRCKGVARPKATYAWFKNGEPIVNNPGKIEARANYLLMNNIDEKDEGMYQCAATNVHGTTFSSGQLKVLSFAPNFEKYPLHSYTQIPMGGNYSIPCKVEAAPVPDVVWLKNGGSLPVVPGDMSGRLGMSMDNDLIFNGVDLSDAGVYTCKASNINGEASNTTRVEVIRGISIQRAPMDTRTLVNRTAFLYCQASYDSLKFDLSYVWKFNGHIIDYSFSTHYIPSKKDGLDGLYIRNAQYKHSGVYTCEALTTLHVDDRSAKLSVDGPPSAPAGTYVQATSITPHSVQLVWTVSPAMNHGSPVNRYDIEAEVGYYPGVWKTVKTDVVEYQAVAEGVNLGLRDDMRTSNVNGLFPNLAYSFRVRAINDFGRGQEASKGSVSIKTPSTAPIKPPNRIRGIKDGKVGTLTIVWDALDISEQCGPGVGYNVYFKKESDPKDWHHQEVTGAFSSNYTHLVGEDNYYLPYEVKIGAYNNYGNGPNSTVHTIMSAEGMIVAAVLMGDCDNYNGTAISMSWTPLEDTRLVLKGRLKGYRVRYWHIDFPEYITYRDLYGQHEETIIIGLEDNTNYWTSVQVMNFAGVGPLGENRLAETFHLPPRQYPRHVKVYSHTKHSVRVTWQGVSTEYDEETIQGYILRVWKIQEDIRTATDTVVEKVGGAVIENLQRQTVYVLRVLGWSIGGEGALSPHVYFTVEGGNVPFDPTTTEWCFDDRKCDNATSLQLSLLTLVLMLLVSYIL